MSTINPMVAALQRLSGREMLINTETADEFVANVSRFAVTTPDEAAVHELAARENLCMVYGIDDPQDRNDRKPFVYQDGVAVIPIHGSLINRFNSSWGFVTGYNFVRRQMNLALEDDDVDYIVFDVNSPGGEAAGCFELAREILASRRVKESLAMVDSVAASGGMALAGAATRMFGIPSARIGSIGVYRQHISFEGALKEMGVKVTFAQAGEHKTDGHPYADLPNSVLRDWTQDVNKTWDDFIDLVADCRGLEPAAVKDTQARVYRADEALAIGLIDAVKTTSEAVPAFIAEMADDNPSDDEEDEEMADAKTKGTEATSAVDYDRIGTMISETVTAAVTNLAAAQSRAAAIRDHGKTKGQVALAARLTANDKITEAEAIQMIDDAAAAAAPKTKGKQKAKGKTGRQRVEDLNGDDEDDEDDDLDDENDDLDEDGDGEDDDAEDEAEKARAARRKDRVGNRQPRDNVNHLDRAMGRNRRDKIGGGNGEDQQLTGDAAVTNTLLADYAAQTGTDLRKKPAA